MKDILKTHFDIDANEIKKLGGYANANYYVEAGNEKYILKAYQYEAETLDFLNDENRILERLSAEIPGSFQEPLLSVHDTYLVIDEQNNKIYRLLRYIDGELLCNAPHNKTLFVSLGSLLAKLDKTLTNQRYLSIMARRHEWDILQIDLSIPYSKLITDVSHRRLVEYFYLQYNEQVRPLLPKLRYSVIHADANDLNVLVKDNQIAGLIDFGDSVYSLLINELAVAITYGMFGKQEPLQWAIPIISSYSTIIQPTEEEADILYYLVAARLCISVCQSAHAKIINPDDKYLTISEQPALSLLEQWITISPIKAAHEFRKAARLPGKISAPTQDDVETRWKYLGKSLSLSYENPIRMEMAAFQYMYDTEGNTLLDLRNNIPHVGHCHPRVVQAGQQKMARLNTNTRYLYDDITAFSEKLLSKFPPALNKVFYVNSGSAASDLAIRLAKTYTGKENIMVMQHGYHGNTTEGINISHYKFAGKGGSGAAQNITVVPIPDFDNKLSRQETEERNLIKIREFINSLADKKSTFAAFITEPIVSAAGQIVLPPPYLQEISSFIREQGGVYISDEVQTGFGRLGNYFWGFEYAGIVPDIVVLGKPIGNGHPMAAVVCTTEIAESFNNGMEFFSSFGGNPVSCAIGLSVLNVIEEENLVQNAQLAGSYLIDQFENLKKECVNIGEIRGMGLSLGIEIVKDQINFEPDTELAAFLVNELKNRNILTGTDGPYDNVFKLKPPLCFSKENADELIKNLRAILLK